MPASCQNIHPGQQGACAPIAGPGDRGNAPAGAAGRCAHGPDCHAEAAAGLAQCGLQQHCAVQPAVREEAWGALRPHHGFAIGVGGADIAGQQGQIQSKYHGQSPRMVDMKLTYKARQQFE